MWFYFPILKSCNTNKCPYNEYLKPYEDDGHNYGLATSDFDWLLNATLASDQSGLQAFSSLQFFFLLFPIIIRNHAYDEKLAII